MAHIKGKVNLAKFKSVLMTGKGKSGPVEGIFIPIKLNKLFKGKDGNLYFNFIGFETPESKFGTHMIKQSFSKEERDAMTEDEQKGQPIFGNIEKEAEFVEQNNLASEKPIDEGGDLPF